MSQRNALLGGLALTSLFFAWFWMAHLSAQDPWYRNTDMNIHNVVDALSLNSGYTPGLVDQPGTTTKFLLAFDLRIRNALGFQPVWTLKRFARSPDPLREYAPLIKSAREHTRMLAVLFIVAGACLAGQVTRRLDCAMLTTILLSGNSGVLFHGMLVRPELLCLMFGGVIAVHFAWLANTSPNPSRRILWLILAGSSSGLAMITKLPAVYCFALIGAWCTGLVLTGLVNPSAARNGVSFRLTLAACLVAGLGALGLLFLIQPDTKLMDIVALNRLRCTAALVTFLPLVGLLDARNQAGIRIISATLTGAALLAGALISFVLWFGLLCTILPAEAAADYMAKILNTLFYPDPLLKLYTNPSELHRLNEASRFFMEAPTLFIVSVIMAGTLLAMRSIKPATKTLVLLLLTLSLGMIVTMSKRQFLSQYSLFAHVPLLLIWPLALAALQAHLRQVNPTRKLQWPAVLIISAAFIQLFSGFLHLRPKYVNYQDDAAVPVRELTITFLYDHDAHPSEYLTAMHTHYASRQEFAAKLNQYLEDSVNRQ